MGDGKRKSEEMVKQAGLATKGDQKPGEDWKVGEARERGCLTESRFLREEHSSCLTIA
jgi:hypothetical protein